MRLQRRSVSPLADQDEVVWIADGLGERVANTTRLTCRVMLGFSDMVQRQLESARNAGEAVLQ